MAPQNRVFIWAGSIVAVSWLALAFIDPDPGGGITEVLGLGYFFGTLFAHATLAATWAALGPARFVWRVPLSLA